MEAKAGAAAGVFFHANVPGVGAYNLLHNAESQTNAILAGRKKWLKDTLAMGQGNAWTIICHLDCQLLPLSPGPYVDASTSRQDLKSIDQEIQKDLNNLLFITGNDSWSRLEVSLDLNLFPLGLWGKHAERVLHNLVDAGDRLSAYSSAAAES